MVAVKTDRWTEGKVFERLRYVFPSPAYVRLSGVRNGTGYARKQERRADGIILSVFPSRGLYMAGVEIKVSRSDWKKELADAEKSHEIQQYCDYWYVAAPVGIVPREELPETWGLIECQENTARIVKRAPKLDAKQVDMLLLCSILRRFSECHTPTCEVDKIIQAKINESVAAQIRNVQYELDAIKGHVDEFEKASGVKIDVGWRGGNIGEAVRAVLAMNDRHDGLPSIRKRMLSNCQYIKNEIDAFIKRLTKDDE